MKIGRLIACVLVCTTSVIMMSCGEETPQKPATPPGMPGPGTRPGMGSPVRPPAMSPVTTPSLGAIGSAGIVVPMPDREDMDEAMAAGSAAAGSAGQVLSVQASKAQALLAQVMDYIKQNKFDLADAGLKQLEGMKDSLPASLAGQIEGAKKALAAAKAKDSIKLPDDVAPFK